MTQAIKLLVPHSFPLQGEKLIEASAGTGKTYTIMTLYLRLLLHPELQPETHDNSRMSSPQESTALKTPLDVKQILVVTFTDAATAELRDRIRKKIAQAKQAFISGSSEDAEISELLNKSEPALFHQHALTLEANERLMDEAAIFTIHGFCQRMLKQNAFESGTFFNIELVESREDIQLQAVKDFWRKKINSLPDDLFAEVLYLWKSPENLLRSLQICLDKKDIEIRANNSDLSLQQIYEQYQSLVQQFKADWIETVNNSDIVSLLEHIQFKKYTIYVKQGILTLYHAVNNWAKSDTLSKVPKELEYFTLSKLTSSTLASSAKPQHELFDCCEIFLTHHLLDEYSNIIKDSIYLDALDFVQQAVHDHKIFNHELSFDDLLNDLDDALSAERGKDFADKIRAQFPVAMIDEFQDTDSVQYRIFSRVYKQQPDTGWYLIGDPKQAIYAFRGADIFTYINAKRAINEQYSLATNWRSSSRMIQAVNRIFTFSPPAGNYSPFVYGDDIPFHPVAPPLREKGEVSHADSSPLYLQESQLDGSDNDRQSPAAMVLLLNTTETGYISKDDYEKNMALVSAHRICRLIKQGEEGKAGINHRPLLASDIAVLVRDGGQAMLVKQALLQRGINSVYLSERSSIFDTQEATGLIYILRACLLPASESHLKTALAVPFLGLTMEELQAYEDDNNLLDELVISFQVYHNQWKTLGVISMLRRLILDYSLIDKYLAEQSPIQEGERRLTDLLHLSELLQDASKKLDSEEALLQWLEQQINSNNIKTQDRQLRLESDQKLVQIVTIHKSKGLEYNIVFMPFVCKYRDNKEPILRYHEESTLDNSLLPEHSAIRQIVDLTHSDAGKQLQYKESLAEEIRLLYVGLTRSIHQCYLGIAPFRAGNTKKCMLHKSAIGYLLNAGEPMTQDELLEKLETLSQHQPVRIDRFSQSSESSTLELSDCHIEKQKKTLQLKSLTFEQTLEQNWWISSFSSLSRFHAQPDASEERIDDAVEADLSNAPQVDSIHSFPRGAQHGTFMHLLFESVDFTDQSGIENTVRLLREKYGYAEKWNAVLNKMLNDCINSPIHGQDTISNNNFMCLNRIKNQQKLVEMEFYLPMKNLDAAGINKIISRFDVLSEKAGKLKFDLVQGMLKGFIDLFFEYQGKYYILDYKSNHLGYRTQDYNQQAMQDAMMEHRYDLQYQFYTLAIHRYLKSRIKDYDYHQHFGGAIYLFLRGVNSDENNQYGVYFTRPDYQLINELDNLFKLGIH